jgi:hypothetical protein
MSQGMGFGSWTGHGEGFGDGFANGFGKPSEFGCGSGSGNAVSGRGDKGWRRKGMGIEVVYVVWAMIGTSTSP